MAAKLNCRQNAADIASVKSLLRSAKETERSTQERQQEFRVVNKN